MSGKQKVKVWAQPKDGRQPYLTTVEKNTDDGVNENTEKLRASSDDISSEISSAGNSKRQTHGVLSDEQKEFIDAHAKEYEDFAEVFYNSTMDKEYGEEMSIANGNYTDYELGDSSGDEGHIATLYYDLDDYGKAPGQAMRREYDERISNGENPEDIDVEELVATHIWNATAHLDTADVNDYIDGDNGRIENYEQFMEAFRSGIKHWNETGDNDEFGIEMVEDGPRIYAYRTLTADEEKSIVPNTSKTAKNSSSQPSSGNRRDIETQKTIDVLNALKEEGEIFESDVPLKGDGGEGFIFEVPGNGGIGQLFVNPAEGGGTNVDLTLSDADGFAHVEKTIEEGEDFHETLYSFLKEQAPILERLYPDDYVDPWG